MDIGRQKGTVYIEPIDEPSGLPVEEPSPTIHQDPARPRPETEPAPSRSG
jgi:hypothetical protein